MTGRFIGGCAPSRATLFTPGGEIKIADRKRRRGCLSPVIDQRSGPPSSEILRVFWIFLYFIPVVFYGRVFSLQYLIGTINICLLLEF